MTEPQNTRTAPIVDEFEGGLVPVDPPTPSVVAEAAAAPDVTALQTEALAAMQAELQALRGELQTVAAGKKNADLLDENASVGGYPWQYYRIPANWPDETSRNWIAYGPGGQSPSGRRDAGAYGHYLKKGFTPITKYGLCDIPKSELGWLNFIPMLQKGGAVEFPTSQVIAYKWHVSPPIKGLKFPQYEAEKANVQVLTCEACGQRLYFMKDDRSSGNTYRAHLMQSHKYPFREAAEAVTKAGFDLAPFFSEVAPV